jgi:hypothetical protein
MGDPELKLAELERIERRDQEIYLELMSREVARQSVPMPQNRAARRAHDARQRKSPC